MSLFKTIQRNSPYAVAGLGTFIAYNAPNETIQLGCLGIGFLGCLKSLEAIEREYKEISAEITAEESYKKIKG